MSKYCLDIALDEDIWDIADILELCAYRCGEASIENVGRIFDVRRENEETDFEGANLEMETYLVDLYSEIADRSSQVGASYPFTYSPCQTKLILKSPDDLTEGAYVYLFCLILSNIPKKKLDNIAISNSERNLFEYCSVVAVAGSFNAHSYHFGFPCDDNSGFLDRLKHIFEDTLNNGKVIDSLRPGSSPYIKDGELDVIAWPIDWRPGHTLYLTQCASGANWKSKSLMHFKASDEFEQWFSRKPDAQMNVGISIPFDLHPEFGADRKDIEEVNSVKFGYILWRFTLPPAIDKGISLFNAGTSHIDKIEKLADLKTWVIAQREQIGEAIL